MKLTLLIVTILLCLLATPALSHGRRRNLCRGIRRLKDKVIEDLKKEIEDLKKEIEDLKNADVPEVIQEPCDTDVDDIDYSIYKNVALNAIVTMSSVFDHNTAPNTLLVDGDRNPKYPCAHTLEDENPWMMIDIQEPKMVKYIYVVNRNDCCAERTNHLQVWLGMTEDNMQLYFYNEAAIGDVCVFKLQTAVWARFVKLMLIEKNYLTICELEVFALI